MRSLRGRGSSALIAAVLLLPMATAGVQLVAGPGSQEIETDVEQEFIFRVSFQFDTQSLVYFKVLPSPGSPVNDNGNPNGTVEDGVGVSGWWMGFRLLDKDAQPVTNDADGNEVDSDLGDFVTTEGTRLILIEADTPYMVEATIHVPAEGANGAGVYKVPFAIVQRAVGGGEGNGGSLDPNKGVTLELIRPGGPLVGEERIVAEDPAKEGTPQQGNPIAIEDPMVLVTGGITGLVILTVMGVIVVTRQRRKRMQRVEAEVDAHKPHPSDFPVQFEFELE